MVSQALLIRLMAVAAVVQAAPLNINLGAYSPALVVGDGAIEFEGGEGGRGVENVVNALQGSRVSGGAAPVAEAPVVAQAQVAEPILREAVSLPFLLLFSPPSPDKHNLRRERKQKLNALIQ